MLLLWREPERIIIPVGLHASDLLPCSRKELSLLQTLLSTRGTTVPSLSVCNSASLVVSSECHVLGIIDLFVEMLMCLSCCSCSQHENGFQ